MKKSVLRFMLMFLMGTTIVFFASCGSDDKNNDDQEQTDTTNADADNHDGHDHDGHDHGDADVDMTGYEYTAPFVCPMHCKGSGSEVAGKCPACGMDYVANENAATDGADANEGDGEAKVAA